jgi:hypothetical protein
LLVHRRVDPEVSRHRRREFSRRDGCRFRVDAAALQDHRHDGTACRSTESMMDPLGDGTRRLPGEHRDEHGLTSRGDGGAPPPRESGR